MTTGAKASLVGPGSRQAGIASTEDIMGDSERAWVNRQSPSLSPALQEGVAQAQGPYRPTLEDPATTQIPVTGTTPVEGTQQGLALTAARMTAARGQQHLSLLTSTPSVSGPQPLSPGLHPARAFAPLSSADQRRHSPRKSQSEQPALLELNPETPPKRATPAPALTQSDTPSMYNNSLAALHRNAMLNAAASNAAASLAFASHARDRSAFTVPVTYQGHDGALTAMPLGAYPFPPHTMLAGGGGVGRLPFNAMNSGSLFPFAPGVSMAAPLTLAQTGRDTPLPHLFGMLQHAGHPMQAMDLRYQPLIPGDQPPARQMLPAPRGEPQTPAQPPTTSSAAPAAADWSAQLEQLPAVVTVEQTSWTPEGRGRYKADTVAAYANIHAANNFVVKSMRAFRSRSHSAYDDCFQEEDPKTRALTQVAKFGEREVFRATAHLVPPGILTETRKGCVVYLALEHVTSQDLAVGRIGIVGFYSTREDCNRAVEACASAPHLRLHAPELELDANKLLQLKGLRAQDLCPWTMQGRRLAMRGSSIRSCDTAVRFVAFFKQRLHERVGIFKAVHEANAAIQNIAISMDLLHPNGDRVRDPDRWSLARHFGPLGELSLLFTYVGRPPVLMPSLGAATAGGRPAASSQSAPQSPGLEGSSEKAQSATAAAQRGQARRASTGTVQSNQEATLPKKLWVRWLYW